MAELTEREPHTRTYINLQGQKSVVHIDRLGSIRVSEELFHALMLKSGSYEIVEEE